MPPTTTVDIDFMYPLVQVCSVVDPFQTEPDEHCPASTPMSPIKPGPLFPTEVHDLAAKPPRGRNSF